VQHPFVPLECGIIIKHQDGSLLADTLARHSNHNFASCRLCLHCTTRCCYNCDVNCGCTPRKVIGLVKGIVPSPKQAGFFSLWNLVNHVWMGAFGIFGLLEPVQRSSALAEYYLVGLSLPSSLLLPPSSRLLPHVR
jgi:hypothetical protein